MSAKRARPDVGAKVPELLIEAVGNGKYATLVALRNQIAGMIDAGVPPRDMASLSKRLMEVIEELESVEGLEAEAKAHEIPDEEFSPITAG